MSKRKKNVEEFFSRYETMFNSAMAGQDVTQEATAMFADSFVESTPSGVMCSNNRGEFVEKARKGLEFYRSIGTRSMTISSTDVTLIDDLHAMAKVYWRYTYDKDGSEGHIDFHVFYFLTNATGELKIFSFIGGDETKLLKEHGLVPEEAETH